MEEKYYEFKEIGTIHSYKIISGITISYYRLNVSDWEEQDDKIGSDIIEINHCQSGRYECEFVDDSFYYLGEGEIAVSRMTDKKKRSGFPLGSYSGINILIDLKECDTNFLKLLTEFNLDIEKLTSKWKEHLPCMIMNENSQVRLLFQALYEMEDDMKEGYIKCRIIELLLHFDQYDFGEITNLSHLKKNQVIHAKHIKEHLEEEVDREMTLEELAVEHAISESSIKRCFKAVYGKSPKQYRKEFRMKKAASLLVESQYTIADIGLQVGYLNSSKFSKAFYSIMNQTPSEFRNEKIVQQDKK